MGTLTPPRPRPVPVVRVTVFGKPGCHLCDEVKATLVAVRRELWFELEEVDVEATPALRERYGERVPLVFVNGRLAFKFRVDGAALRRRLAREALTGRLRDRLRALRPGPPAG